MSVLHFAAEGCSYDIISFLISRGARVDWPENDSQSAFILAARENNVEALRALFERGANINRSCTLGWAEGRTAYGVLLLEQSQGYGNPEALAYLKSIGSREWPE